ncbi:DUF4271 domain-containing protein [Filimonas effusa]|uniref:DUF4271 domain-containing protein n=1 Tax=Filimonas effusa TaxID=2508721 RepID=UPI0013E943C7|nr:DUF4271 domain-containing protein [Filimonas effusa]
MACFTLTAQSDTVRKRVIRQVPAQAKPGDTNKPAVRRASVTPPRDTATRATGTRAVAPARAATPGTGNSVPAARSTAPPAAGATVAGRNAAAANTQAIQPAQAQRPGSAGIITDSAGKLRADSMAMLRAARDTVALVTAAKPAPIKKLTWQEDTLFRRALNVKYLPAQEKPAYMITSYWVRESTDYLFYLLAGLVLFLAFIKATFPKYFQQVFKMLFQTSFRQKQTREQLAQNLLPSMFMNLLFVLVVAAFIAVVVTQKKLTTLSFWELMLYSTAGLIALYCLKYLFLRFTGWVFRVKEASETYIFIVFLVNKLLGVILLPMLWLVSFSSGELNVVGLTASLCIAGLLVLYRYILSLAAVRDMLRVSAFHFFIYLCGVEILPIIIIYKVLFNKTGFTI